MMRRLSAARRFEFFAACTLATALFFVNELVLHELIHHGLGEPWGSLIHFAVVFALVTWLARLWYHSRLEAESSALEAARLSEARFRSLTGLSADWFWETDADHRLQWIAGGQPVLRLFGPERAYGKHLWEAEGLDLSPESLAAHRAALEAKAPFYEFELRKRCPEDGSVDTHLVSGEPCFDAEGRFTGYRGMARDVSEQRRADFALSEAKDRLELAVRGGSLAIWDVDLSTGRVYLSESWDSMLGTRFPGNSTGLDVVARTLHPQDVQIVREATRRCLRGELATASVEVRARTGSGEWKWLNATGRVTRRDASGWALRLSGVAVDIDRRKRAEQATRDAEARYRNLIELSPDGVLVQCNGVVEYANPAAARLLGASGASQLVGRNLIDRIEPAYLEMVKHETRFLSVGPGQTAFLELHMRRFDGGVALLEAAGVSYLERGRLVMQIVIRDISGQLEAKSELAERERRFRDVVEASGEYVWETDAQMRYTWLSARVEAVLGHMRSDLLGQRPQDFMPLGEVRSVGEQLARMAARREPFREFNHRSITKSGKVIWQSISGVPVLNEDGTLKGYRGTGADITARKLAEERIQYLATRDALTGLPNRLLLADRAEQALLNARRNGGRIAVLSFDIDRFLGLNEAIGHQAGDSLLRALSERLAGALRRDDTLARLGGDEFVLLWDGTREFEDVALVAQKVLASVAQPFNIDGRTLSVTASVGISVFPGDGRNFAELLKNAEAALHAVKDAGGNAYRFFSPEMDTRAAERFALENDLRGALAREEFELHYQPVMQSVAGRPSVLVGAEVLLRWNHPVRGLLSPAEFIPLAESSGQIGALGAWMMEQACARIGAWREGALANLRFSLNVSAREFAPPGAFAARLARALRANGLRGEQLRLEVSEASIQLGRESDQVALREVAALGVDLVVDDFGVAQSSLARLRALPLKALKIDGGFVRKLGQDRDAEAIVQTIAAMAHGLGLGVCAEGVESEAQLARLKSIGCNEWQGHLCSEPVQAEEFERRYGGHASTRALAS